MKVCSSRWQRRVALWSTALLAPVMVVACQSVQTTRAGVVGIDRQQQMSSLVSATQVDTEARQQYVAVLRQSGQKGQLNRDPAETDRVRRIALRLIPQTAVFRDDAPRWQWEVNVIESAEVNA